MSDLDSIKAQIDEANLTPEERGELVGYLSTSGTVAKQGEELAKNFGGQEGGEESVEEQKKTFCGIEVESLTKKQKELFDKLSEEERKDFSKIARINRPAGQIEFSNIKLAIKDKDTVNNVTKKEADEKVKELEKDGWKLPGDVDFDESNRYTLNAEESEYDAMILEMPGQDDDEKVENFRLLTGTYGWYWTSQKYDKSSSKFVVRKFNKNKWGRGRYYFNDIFHVRVVRPLS